MVSEKTYEQLAAENELLRAQLEEATAAIDAIRTGQVDALVVESEQGHELFSLKTADHTYRIFIETMHEGAVTLNRQGLILYGNATFAAIAGRALSAIIGTPFADVVPPGGQATYRHFFDKSWAAPHRMELPIGPASAPTVCLLSATPLALDDEPCLSIIITDLTAQKETQALLESNNHQLAQMNVALNRSNENLQQFAYVASHDLQEPLRKIQSFSVLIRDQYGPALGDAGTDILGRMELAGARMSLLIRDLLTLSRVGAQRSTPVPVALDQVVAEVMETLAVMVQETGAEVRLQPLPTVLGDASQLRQLFQNLLSNALKFRRPGVSPQITVQTIPVTADNIPPELRALWPRQPVACITVTDNGIGFDPKHSTRIFQVFQRLHGRNEFAGTGIGLAISHKVVTNHGGAITADSQPGEGATFRVFLPA